MEQEQLQVSTPTADTPPKEAQKKVERTMSKAQKAAAATLTEMATAAKKRAEAAQAKAER